jgi:hypothetical protein
MHPSALEHSPFSAAEPASYSQAPAIPPIRLTPTSAAAFCDQRIEATHGASSRNRWIRCSARRRVVSLSADWDLPASNGAQRIRSWWSPPSGSRLRVARPPSMSAALPDSTIPPMRGRHGGSRKLRTARPRSFSLRKPRQTAIRGTRPPQSRGIPCASASTPLSAITATTNPLTVLPGRGSLISQERIFPSLNALQMRTTSGRAPARSFAAPSPHSPRTEISSP